MPLCFLQKQENDLVSNDTVGRKYLWYLRLYQSPKGAGVHMCVHRVLLSASLRGQGGQSCTVAPVAHGTEVETNSWQGQDLIGGRTDMCSLTSEVPAGVGSGLVTHRKVL